MKLLRSSMPTLRSSLPTLEQAQAEHRDAEAMERKRLYSTQAWRKLRKAQLKRQPWCQCGQRASVADHVLGHADPDWRARFFNPRLLQSLCSTCHSRKTSTTEGAFGNARARGGLPAVGGAVREVGPGPANHALLHSVKEKFWWEKGPAGGKES